MDNDKWIRRDQYEVKSWDIDYAKRLTMQGVARFIQESAYQNAEELGFGYHRMSKNGMTWVMSRIQIRMLDFPYWGDKIVLETWPKGKESAFYLRDFRFVDAKGTHFGSVTSSWLLIDLLKRRPRSFKPLDALSEKLPDRHAIRKSAPKIDPVAGPSDHFQSPVYFSDIDVNGHMNFCRYVKWMEDLSKEASSEYVSIKEVVINFLSELHEGDTVVIHRQIQPADGSCFFSFVSKNLNTESARGWVQFE